MSAFSDMSFFIISIINKEKDKVRIMERKEFLKNVFGYHKIKDELYEIRSWYLNEKNDEGRKEFLPKGILFYVNQDLEKHFY